MGQSLRIRHPACALLRKLISPYGYGTKDALGYHRPTNKALVDDYNTRGYIRGLTNAQMMDHFEGRSTVYFWADGRIRTPRALICIDIDCHKFGSLAAALIFAKYLAETIFPGLYIEPSTNGKGVHAYLIIDKRGFGDLYLHGLCRLLDETLKVVHREWQAGNPHLPVEGVEIKGHPPRIEWTRDGRIDEFTSGQFVKLPREMLSRFDEFARTTVLDDRRINDLYRRHKDRPVILAMPASQPAGKGRSLTGCAVKQADLDRWDAYLTLARELLPRPIKTSGREVATAEDMAVFLLILEACTNAMNADGSLPTARIRENWEVLHANGDVQRPWVAKRYTALRNHLSREGQLDWEDSRYIPGSLSPTGEGQAAKWRASESLMQRIEDAKCPSRQGAGSQGSLDLLRLSEGEEDLYGDNISNSVPEQPVPRWIIALKRANYVQPTLDPSIGRLRLAG